MEQPYTRQLVMKLADLEQIPPLVLPEGYQIHTADVHSREVWEAIGEKPLFGHRSGKNAKTFWGCFMKLGLPEAPEGGDKHE